MKKLYFSTILFSVMKKMLKIVKTENIPNLKDCFTLLRKYYYLYKKSMKYLLLDMTKLAIKASFVQPTSDVRYT